MKKNIIYFCREYNDIDHVVPIAAELLNNHDVDSLCFYNYNVEKSYQDDYRIKYLNQHNNFIFRELSSDLSTTENLFYKLCTLCQKTFFISKKFNHVIITIRSKFINRLYNKFDFNKLINTEKNYILLFDHSNSNFIDNAYNYSSKHAIPVGLLLHGINPTENLLMSTKMLKINSLDKSWQHNNKADAFFVNNEHYEKRSLAHGVSKEIISIIGSPRFSFKWSNILENITPDVDLPTPGPNYVKIVIMLNKYRYNTWKEEIERVIKSLLLIDDVFIIVKPHTRKMIFDGFNNDRIFIADQDCHSRRLFEWSDLTLFTISSIFLDALLLDKPVLFLRLATSNKLSCNHIMKDWNVDSRDDLISWINKFKENRKTRTYTEKERIQCLNYYVNDGDNQLLSRYCKSILELKKRGQ